MTNKTVPIRRTRAVEPKSRTQPAAFRTRTTESAFDPYSTADLQETGRQSNPNILPSTMLYRAISPNHPYLLASEAGDMLWVPSLIDEMFQPSKGQYGEWPIYRVQLRFWPENAGVVLTIDVKGAIDQPWVSCRTQPAPYDIMRRVGYMLDYAEVDEMLLDPTRTLYPTSTAAL